MPSTRSPGSVLIGGVEVFPVGDLAGVERLEQLRADELRIAVAGNGDDVGRGIGALGGEQIVLLALVVGQADADLDAGVLLELVDEFLQELVVGGDVDDLALSEGWTDDRRRSKDACAGRQQL